MKKLAIIALVFMATVFMLSSCQSHGPKCPGMYSQANDIEQIQPL